MPRKKLPAAPTTNADVIDGAAIAADHQEHAELLDQRNRILAAVDARFGLDQPYDLDRYINHARDAVNVIGQRLFVIGRICIAIKEHEPHGAFLPALDRIGIKPRFAQKCMTTALKFEGSEARKLVAAQLSSAKLLELLSEDDEEIDGLIEEGGTLAGLTLDDIQKMSFTDLREALRKEREKHTQELEARDAIIERKDKKLHELDLQRRGLKRKPALDKALELLASVDACAVELLSAGERMKEAMHAVLDVYQDAGEDLDESVELRIRQAADTAAEIVAGIEHLKGA